MGVGISELFIGGWVGSRFKNLKPKVGFASV